jgi:hypothetical protein
MSSRLLALMLSLLLRFCASEYVLSVFKDSQHIIESIRFEVPESINARDGVHIRVTRGEKVLYSGDLDKIRHGDIDFKVPDNIIIRGRNDLMVEFYIPPSNEVIAKSSLVVNLGKDPSSRSLFRRTVLLSGGAVAGLSGLAYWRRRLNDISKAHSERMPNEINQKGNCRDTVEFKISSPHQVIPYYPAKSNNDLPGDCSKSISNKKSYLTQVSPQKVLFSATFVVLLSRLISKLLRLHSITDRDEKNSEQPFLIRPLIVSKKRIMMKLREFLP